MKNYSEPLESNWTTMAILPRGSLVSQPTAQFSPDSSSKSCSPDYNLFCCNGVCTCLSYFQCCGVFPEPCGQNPMVKRVLAKCQTSPPSFYGSSWVILERANKSLIHNSISILFYVEVYVHSTCYIRISRKYHIYGIILYWREILANSLHQSKLKPRRNQAMKQWHSKIKGETCKNIKCHSITNNHNSQHSKSNSTQQIQKLKVVYLLWWWIM